MEYRGFVVRAFEREPGKWRAKVLRPGREPLIKGRTKIMQFIIGMDRTTPSAALLAALEAIDAGAFSRAPTLPETYWRSREWRRMRGRSAPQTVLSKSDPDEAAQLGSI